MNMENLLFAPPEKVIDSQGRSSFYHCINKRSTKADCIATMLSVGVEIASTYRINNPLEARNIGISIQPVFLEALKNGILHGPQKGVVAGVFINYEGVCYGFRDFGRYFERESIKALWESRGPIPSTGKEDGRNVFGAGTELIFGNSDKIYVDTFKRILYCFQTKSRIMKTAQTTR